jgi:two-component system, sensor histidine kinase YesM
LLSFLGSFIHNLFKIRFFGKIMLTYTVILTITITTLTFIISQNITHELLINEKKLNKQILIKVNNHLNQSYELAKNTMVRYLYMDKIAYNDVVQYMIRKQDATDYDYLLHKKAFDNVFSMLSTRESSIYSISVYNNKDSSIRVFGRSIHAYNYESNFNYNRWECKIDKSHFKPVLIPAHRKYYSDYPNPGKSWVYTFASNLRDTKTNAIYGTLAMEFKVDDIFRTYEEYTEDLKGSIIIVTKAGDVIYDSSGKYYGIKYPYTKILEGKPASAMLEEKCLINTYDSEIPDVIIGGIIPESSIYTDINKLNLTIGMISFACIIVTLVLSNISVSVFSRRVKGIIQAMKKVRKGDLSVKIPVKQNDDEMGEIGTSFNEMCNDLKNYINKVYLSEIRQKNAELSALQSQINPHFLYNSLETIRMKAETEGNGDTAHMIYILATLLRNIVKEDTFIDIRSEIKYCNLYLEMYKFRYGDKLTVDMEIDTSILVYGTANHLLQPLIENYIVHGFDILKDENRITIKGYKKENDIYFEVIDNGKGIDEDQLQLINSKFLENSVKSPGNHNSIGLANVHERAKIIYGSDYGLILSSQRNAGTKVVLRIQAKTKEELRQNVQSFNC